MKLDGDVRMGPMGRPEQVPPTVVAERIREILEVETLPSDIQKIPDDIAVLMVAHPKNLSPRTLFAIDQYLLGGGKAAIFVDPLAESEAGAGGGPMGGASSSTLQPIFDAWGLEMPTDKVVADRFAARRVGAANGRDYITYVPWLLLRGARNLNRESPITAQVETLAVASAGYLKAKEGAPVTHSPLATPSPGSMLIPMPRLHGPVAEPGNLLRDEKAGSEA